MIIIILLRPVGTHARVVPNQNPCGIRPLCHPLAKYTSLLIANYHWVMGVQANLQSFILPTTYFGRPMGPGPWVVELSELVVTCSGVVVIASVFVAVIVVPASVVSSLTVVVGIVLSVAGADVELVDGGLEAQT